MRSLYKQNLLKSGWIMVDTEQVRVIDSNKTIEERLISEKEDTSKLFALPAFDAQDESNNAVDLLFAEGISEGIEAEELQEEPLPDAKEHLQKAQAQAEEILAAAQAQAEEICRQAQLVAEQDARTAYEDARRRGEQDGYREGLGKANAEAEMVRREYAEKEQRLCEQYNQKLEEMEPYLIQQLTGIYEHVFGVELSGHRNILQHLLAATLRSVEISEHYLIHVSEQDYPYVSMQKSQIVEEGCVKNASLEIAEDRTLGKNECLIETENGIFDCSLSTQLTELKRKLQLLSYTGMKE